LVCNLNFKEMYIDCYLNRCKQHSCALMLHAQMVCALLSACKCPAHTWGLPLYIYIYIITCVVNWITVEICYNFLKVQFWNYINKILAYPFIAAEWNFWEFCQHVECNWLLYKSAKIKFPIKGNHKAVKNKFCGNFYFYCKSVHL
jgi:hypothetical protein